MRVPRPRSLAGQLFAMQVVLVAAVVAGCAIFAYLTARGQAEDAAGRQATAAARAIADSPSVRAAIHGDDPSALLQPYAERVRKDTGVAFVTIMNPRGIRWTHPDPARIGQEFLGHTGPALQGRTFTETYTGTLGPSVRVVTPIRDGERADGRIIGLVSAGITVERISAQVERQLAGLLVVAAAAVVLGGIATYVVNARLRRHTHGMNAAELSRMHDYHQAALHAVREGLLMLDGQRRIALINDAGRELLGLDALDALHPKRRKDEDVVSRNVPDAGRELLGLDALDALHPKRRKDEDVVSRNVPDAGRELLGLDALDALHLKRRQEVVSPDGPDTGRELRGVGPDVIGRNVAELGLPAPLTGALLAAEPRVDEVHMTADRIVVVNTSPVSSGEKRGTVVTLRDHTELQALSGELDSVRGVTEALRSQAHEAANRLHTVVSLIELGRADEAVEFATAELELAQALTDTVVGAVAEPVLAALLLGKAAQANERGVELVLTPDSSIHDGVLPDTVPARDLVTVLGNLIDNAVDAAAGGANWDADRAHAGRRARVTVTALADEAELLLRVSDNGPGVDAAEVDAIFRRGWSTKSPASPAGSRGLGLALVRQAVRRNGGTIQLDHSADGGAEFTVRLPLGAGVGT
ncbi:sensor histidine kinase [Streptomyces sp. 7N604]|uniref:sensor histidine kinase n=1 Tax=Streptomyces sp. 7N604 TaxID=3457415 RepID=UPI003FD1481D